MATTITANGINFPDGSAGSPSIGGSDTNTGLFTGADIIGFSTGGSERLRIDSSGNVGIGTTSPTGGKLHIAHGNELGLFTSGPYNFQAKFESTDAEAAIVIEDNGSTNDGNRIGVISDVMAFTTAGSERMRIDSSGNVGIGTTSSEGKLHVHNASAGSVTAAADANVLVLESDDSNGMSFINPNDERAVIRFGTTGTGGQNEANISYAHEAVSTTGDRRRLFFKTGGNGLRMSIGNNGSHAQIFMNCTESFSNAMLSLQTNGTTGIGIKTGATNQQFCINFRNPNGEVGTINTSGSGTSYNTSSDYRLKENAVAISDGISRLKTLIPYRFNFKADATTTVDGFFAHEVTAVPEAITGTKDEVDSDNNPVYQGIDQSKLVPLLTAALQEAVAKIEVLETKVAALEAG